MMTNNINCKQITLRIFRSEGKASLGGTGASALMLCVTHQDNRSDEVPAGEKRSVEDAQTIAGWERIGVYESDKYHWTGGLSANQSTFMPKNPERNVRGRKIKVIQLSLHRLALMSKDRRVSLMATDLYICR